MATQRKVTEDVGSEELRLVRQQLNRLTVLLEAIKDAADTETTGDAWRIAVAALTGEDDFEEILTDRDRPNNPTYTV